MTDCIIFDFDGTIADTSAGIIATTQEAFRQLGFPEISEEQIRPTIGLVLEQSLQRAAGLTAEQTIMAARKYREIFPEYGASASTLFPGVAETLAEFSSRGFRMAIATSRGRDSLEMIMAPYGIEKYFDDIVTATDGLAPKPAPDLVLALLARMKQPAENTLVVGDRRHHLRHSDGCRSRMPDLRCQLRKPDGDAASNRVSGLHSRQFRRTSGNRLNASNTRPCRP